MPAYNRKPRIRHLSEAIPLAKELLRRYHHYWELAGNTKK